MHIIFYAFIPKKKVPTMALCNTGGCYRPRLLSLMTVVAMAFLQYISARYPNSYAHAVISTYAGVKSL